MHRWGCAASRRAGSALARDCLGREVREREVELRAQIRGDCRLAAGHRYHRHRRGRRRVGRHRQQRPELDQAVQIFGSGDLMAAKERLVDRVLARDRAGVRGDHMPRVLAAPHFDHRDAFAARSRVRRRGREPRGVTNRLEKHEDHLHAIVAHEIVQVVSGVDVRFVAGRHHVAELKLAPVLGERDADRPALGDEGDASRIDLRDVSGPAHHPVVVVDEAHVVRAADRDAVTVRNLHQPLLPCLAFRAAVGVAAARHHRTPDPDPAGPIEHLGAGARRQCEVQQIRRAREILEIGVAGEPQDLVVARVDWIDRPGKTVLEQHIEHHVAVGCRARRRTCHRDSLRLEQAIERDGRSVTRHAASRFPAPSICRYRDHATLKP